MLFSSATPSGDSEITPIKRVDCTSDLNYIVYKFKNLLILNDIFRMTGGILVKTVSILLLN